MTIFELMPLIQTRKKALEFFQRLRWQDGLVCHNCGLLEEDIELHGKTKLGYQRYKCFCGHVFSDTSGTVFHRKRIAPEHAIFALYELSQNKTITSVELGQKLGIGQKRAWSLLTVLREYCRVLVKPFYSLMMRGVTEGDEAYFGKGENTVMVQGILQRGKHAVLLEIEDRTEATLKGNIEKHVQKHSYIMTDTASAYFGLDCKGYRHFTVNHSIGQYSKGRGIHENTMEGYWGNQKKILYGIHHGVSKKRLWNYLAEFLLKYNLKQKEFTFPSFLHLFFHPPLTC
jgi:transposase-like protein